MFKKSLYRLMTPVTMALILTACSDSDGQSNSLSDVNSSPVIKEGSVNELFNTKIRSASIEAGEESTNLGGAYFISPDHQFASLGLSKSDESGSIDDNGYNYAVVSDIFDTEIDTMRLSLYYNTKESKDRFNNILGQWRSSYNSYIDFNVDYENLNIKSSLYDSARSACESGFDEIKNSLYRGILLDTSSVFDDSKSLCIIRRDGQDIGHFNVWNTTNNIVGDFHYLSKNNGDVLVFAKDQDGRYISDDKGVEVELIALEAGGYEYIDANSRVYSYDNSGNLVKIMVEGVETLLSYDANKKIIKVDGPLNLKMAYNYNSDETLSSVAYGDKSLLFSYDSEHHLAAIDIETKNVPVYEVDINGTLVDINTSEENNLSVDDVTETTLQRFASFTYDENTLLRTITRPKVEEKNIETNSTETIDEGGTTTYSYDLTQKVVDIAESDGETTTIEYEPNAVIRSFSSGKSVVENITFSGSKQQVERIDDGTSNTDATYNGDAQAVNIEVLSVEAPQVDENGSIVAQSLGSTKSLSLSMSYNKRGLVNKIQYSSVDSGNKFTELEYKSRYPKPTKVLTNESVTFFDYNQKGQLVKKTSLKFDKEMKLKTNAVTVDTVLGSQERSEKEYVYGDQGFLQEVTDVVQDTKTRYSTNPDGSTSEQRIKAQWYSGGWYSWYLKYIAWLSNSKKEGWTPATGSISAANSNTKVVFVEGAGGGWVHNNVENYANNVFGAQSNRYEFFRWYELDNLVTNAYPGDPFNKDRDKLIVVAHSWGGDSAIEASTNTHPSRMVDLLVTVDPVGNIDVRSGAKYWIEIYADSGNPYGKYLKWVKRSKVITWQGPGRCGWRPCWKKYSKRIYWWDLSTFKVMKWNPADWTAWAGGKGWYSSYDPGKARPDKLLRIAAHHDEFGYMLWKMERGKGSNVNDRFKITDPDNNGLVKYDGAYTETTNSVYPQSFTTNLWR